MKIFGWQVANMQKLPLLIGLDFAISMIILSPYMEELTLAESFIVISDESKYKMYHFLSWKNRKNKGHV
jgi:hypothetical protein